jgi:hypothetical protein
MTRMIDEPVAWDLLRTVTPADGRYGAQTFLF